MGGWINKSHWVLILSQNLQFRKSVLTKKEIDVKLFEHDFIKYYQTLLLSKIQNLILFMPYTDCGTFCKVLKLSEP